MYEKAKLQSMRTRAISLVALLAVGCAPTYAPQIAMPQMPAPDLESATHCTSTEKREIAALDPPPVLPDDQRSPCPLGSGLAACFTLDQDLVRQQRFKILHDDRDYCRDAYARAAGTAVPPTKSAARPTKSAAPPTKSAARPTKSAASPTKSAAPPTVAAGPPIVAAGPPFRGAGRRCRPPPR